MNLYYNILKSFLLAENYKRYHSYLDYKAMKDEVPDIFKLFTAVRYLQDQSSKDYSIDDVEIALFTLYPNTSKEAASILFQQFKDCNGNQEAIQSYLGTIRQRELATTLARNALAVSEGQEGINLVESFKDWENASALQELESEGEDFVNDDLDYLRATQNTTTGLRWRLGTLNKALGSLRKGDFGFVFARPETGKTTFLSSEASFMAEQTTDPILWFNNEEQGGKVQLRCYQASLGVSLLDLYANTEENKRLYTARTGNRIKIIADPTITRKRVEELCEKYQPSLVIFDQIDKIKGFSEDRNDLELKAIYIWAREIAKQYCPVIGVCQAGASGDFKRWLTMNDVDNSKTGKQGEADWILGIGKVADEGMEFIRYLHLSKNKLLGDQDADPEMRHGKWEVKIQPEIARYADLTN